jgi:hypothetical protein
MFSFMLREDGKVSKTMVVSILEIAIAILGLVATFLKAGDFTVASIVLLIAGILGIILRQLTELPMM